MPDGFEIDLSVLRNHAKDVRTLMGNISSATESAASLVDLEAYGLLGTQWAGILNGFFIDADDFVKSAVAAGDKVATELDEMANEYERMNSAAQQDANDLITHLDSQGPH